MEGSEIEAVRHPTAGPLHEARGVEYLNTYAEGPKSAIFAKHLHLGPQGLLKAGKTRNGKPVWGFKRNNFVSVWWGSILEG